MEVFIALLPILGVLLPFIIERINAHISTINNPATKNKDAHEAIDQQISTMDSNTLTVGGGADLDELERLQRAAGSNR